jgi:cell division protease FtsH
MIEYGNPLVKVTIVPRGRALGAAWYAPEERQIIPTQALLDSMCGLLAGRAAEEVFTGQIGTGASDDLEKCTKMARSLVLVYGMSDKLPNINYNDSTGQEMGFTKPYSEETAEIIDQEVKRIINEQYARAKEILRLYATEHNQIRDLLIEREVIFHDDVEKILGKRQWKSRTDEIMELNQKEEAKREAEKALPTPEQSDLGTPKIEAPEDDGDAGTPPPFNK